MITDTKPTGRAVHLGGIILIAVAAAGAVTFALRRKHAEAREIQARNAVVDGGPKVIVTKAVAAPPSRPVVLQGDVRAFRQATIYAKVSGYLKSISVDRGDRVEAGQVLGVLESPETLQQEAAAQADLNLRRLTERRVRSLAPSGLVSQQEVDNAAGSLDVARAESARIKALRGYEVLRAPFDGRITARYVDQGALLSAATSSTTSAQEIVEVADTSRVRIFVYPGQLDATRVHEGDVVSFWSDAEPARRRTDEIVRIAHALDPRTRTMLAEIEVDNADESLRPGSYVHVEVTIPTTNGVVVPADSIVLRAGKPFVALARAGKATFVPVDVADDDGKLVRLASGVALGDDVITHPSDDVIEGGAVTIATPKKP